MTGMSLKAFYVLVSRALLFDSLRWGQCDPGELEKLLGLQHHVFLAAWVRAYRDRRYDHALALDALRTAKKQRQKSNSRKRPSPAKPRPQFHRALAQTRSAPATPSADRATARRGVLESSGGAFAHLG